MSVTRRLLALLTAMITLLCAGMAGASGSKAQAIAVSADNFTVVQGGAYTSLEEVAVYLSVFGTLPANYITKKAAQALGWDSRMGNLDEVAPGKSIGGDRFGNYEGQLPEANGREWTECDIDSGGRYRNAKRIVFSNDGLIFYSDDHYHTFRQILVTGTVAVPAQANADIRKSGAYLSRDDVAAYLHLYGKLPYNYMTRNEAKKLGWSSHKDNLGELAPGYAIGGDSFSNREGLLPDADGRVWCECDVNVQNGERSAERLVWSNDGLIYFTPDGHKSFERLY